VYVLNARHGHSRLPARPLSNRHLLKTCIHLETV
jgi:hypothetical protein